MKCAAFIAFFTYNTYYIQPINTEMMCYMDTMIYKGMGEINGLKYRECQYLDKDKNPIVIDWKASTDFLAGRSDEICTREPNIHDAISNL